MKETLRRRLALALSLSLVGALAVVSAPAATADESSRICTVLLETTPGIEVDLDNDGNPEFRAPRIYDVTFCSYSVGRLDTYPPTVENCSEFPKVVRCVAVRVTIMPVDPYVYAEGELCYSVEGGTRECVRVVFDGPSDIIQQRTVCVGVDLDGGHPCDGSFFSLQ
ncbi:MAG: hypothetical protein M3273_00290 [Actinomycetota bacterium]|nr:hypothetical protein [Actinomycetota bacterium]